MTAQLWITAVMFGGWIVMAIVARLWWHQAVYDRLTGLPGRARLGTLAARARWRRGSVGLLLLDVDRFKQVNDTHGHRVGDELLVAFAARLRRATCRGEVAIRLHGDEFAVWLGTVESNAVPRRAGEMAVALAQPIRVGGHELVLTASVGHAIGPARTTPLADLLARADTSMYAAKRNRPTLPSLPVTAPALRPRDHGKDVA